MAIDHKEQMQTTGEQAAARPRSRRLRIVGLAAASGAVAVATVISVGPQLATAPIAVAAPAPTKPTAVVSGVGNPVRLNLYLSSLSPAYNDMQNALQDIDASLKNKDYDATEAACQELGDAGAQFKALTPSPDSRVTPRIREAADNIATATSLCLDFGPSTTYEDYKHVMSYVQEAMDDLYAAKRIIAPTS